MKRIIRTILKSITVCLLFACETPVQSAGSPESEKPSQPAGSPESKTPAPSADTLESKTPVPSAESVESGIPSAEYVEHEAIIIVKEPMEGHAAHASDPLIDSGEVLMKLDDERKIVLVKDDTRTAEDLVKFLSENDRVVSAETNNIARMD